MYKNNGAKNNVCATYQRYSTFSMILKVPAKLWKHQHLKKKKYYTLKHVKQKQSLTPGTKAYKHISV